MYAKKLKKELAEIKGASRYVNEVKQEVFNAVMNFCGQSAEFAQAVEQSSKTFGQCCEAVVKNCGSCLSDIEAFRRAADFYFPGAKIEFRMVIHMSEWEEPGEAPAVEGANLQTSGESPTDSAERIAEKAREEAEPEKPKEPEPKKAALREIALDLFDLL